MSNIQDKHYYPSFSLRLMRMLHLDHVLLLGIGALLMVGLVVLYSAGDESTALMNRQLTRIALAVFVMLIIAQIPSSTLRFWSPWMTGKCLWMSVTRFPARFLFPRTGR